MKIELKEGMRFQSKDTKEGFVIRKHDFYGDGELKWCAFTDKFIYPIDEIILAEYIPNVDGKWINEENEFIY